MKVSTDVRKRLKYWHRDGKYGQSECFNASIKLELDKDGDREKLEEATRSILFTFSDLDTKLQALLRSTVKDWLASLDDPKTSQPESP